MISYLKFLWSIVPALSTMTFVCSVYYLNSPVRQPAQENPPSFLLRPPKNPPLFPTVADMNFKEAIPCRNTICSSSGWELLLSRQDYADYDHADQRADEVGTKSR